MINCSEIAAMITELSSQVTLIRFFILLHTHMVLEQLHCKSAREAACKAPQLIITNQPALKTTHPIHGLLKYGIILVYAGLCSGQSVLTEFRNTVLPITWFKSMPRYASPPAAEQTNRNQICCIHSPESTRAFFFLVFG